jgi:N-acetyl sugar amidotransferase
MSNTLRKCNNCLLPETYETLAIDQDGSSCNMCKGSTFKHKEIDWDKRKKMLDKVIEKYRGKYDYDCIVPFSGGKDSTYTLYYLMKEYKIKPLVVRFNHGFMRSNHENNVTTVLKKLGADFINFTPNWQIVKKLMWEAFSRKTDFCWHCHTGIYSYPLQVALKFNVPLVLWGEPLAELSAYYTYEDEIIEWENEEKFNMVRNLGITADDMWGMINKPEDPIDKRDLMPYTYPKLEDLQKMNYYSVCLGSFIPWDYKKHTKIIIDELGWNGDELEGVPESINQEFAKIECWMQGTRDYIKYLKRGYGRVTQLVNFEIRNDRMSTEEAQKWIDEYEGRKPQSLEVFLEYMGITEQEFNDQIRKFVVPPFEPNFESIPLGEKVHDMDEWYRENNMKKDL